MSQQPEDDITLEESMSDSLLKEPQLYDVVLMNDDYTTMEFVIDVLMRFFAKTYPVAENIMKSVHYQGSARVATYPKEIAESKVAQVMEYAKENNFPLLCQMRPH